MSARLWISIAMMCLACAGAGQPAVPPAGPPAQPPPPPTAPAPPVAAPADLSRAWPADVGLDVALAQTEQGAQGQTGTSSARELRRLALLRWAELHGQGEVVRQFYAGRTTTRGFAEILSTGCPAMQAADAAEVEVTSTKVIVTLSRAPADTPWLGPLLAEVADQDQKLFLTTTVGVFAPNKAAFDAGVRAVTTVAEKHPISVSNWNPEMEGTEVWEQSASGKTELEIKAWP